MNTDALPSPLWAAGFSFSTTKDTLHRGVRYDPTLHGLFFGEEISMAARSELLYYPLVTSVVDNSKHFRYFTSGCDFWSPPEAVVYHLWSREHKECSDRKPRRDPGTEAVKAEQRFAAQCRVLHLLRGEIDSQDAFGLGTDRTIDDFEHSIGVHFEDKRIRAGSHRGAVPETSFSASDINALVGGMVAGSDISASSGAQQFCSSPGLPIAPKIAALELVRQFINS